jgi:CheY-like chemotaxis protein
VLVVEDDDATREALVMGLEHAGWVVVGAADGRAALDLLRGGLAPRVIVLDLMMPVMDGHEFRRQLLEDAALASIPLVVVSADMWASRLAGAPGVHAVLMKPVDLDDLLRSLEGSCTR